MVTKSDFGERKSRQLFDRVELDGLSPGDMAFELARGMDLAERELRSISWVYDPSSDSLVWSESLEAFFGFEEGTQGFSIRQQLAPGAADTGAGAEGDTFGPVIDRIREIQPWDHGDYRIVLKDGSFVNFSRRYRSRLSHLFR